MERKQGSFTNAYGETFQHPNFDRVIVHREMELFVEPLPPVEPVPMRPRQVYEIGKRAMRRITRSGR